MSSKKKLPPNIAVFNNLYSIYKSAAKRRGLAFELTKEDVSFLTKMNCHYCGVEPSKQHTLVPHEYIYVCNGIDRLNNEKGYTMNNVVPCCEICNKAKRDMTVKEFYIWLDRVCTFRSTNM